MLSAFALSLVLVGQSKFSSDPSQVQLHFEDVERFYKVLDSASDEELGARLKSDYLKSGSVGLAFFRLTKIRLDDMFVAYVKKNKEQLVKDREKIFRIKDAEKRIRASFFAFKHLNPDAVFPPLYFVIGRETSGGTAFSGGLVMGAEMSVNDPALVHQIVAHELIHFNQKMGSGNLLNATLAEGMADFLGELSSGGCINSPLHKYGNAHEVEIWNQWKHDVANGNKIADWIGTYSQTVPRPGDLGYFVGYKISQAYYDKAPDKLKAIRELLTRKDAAKIVEESGYDPK
jgi:hypothetical protein